MTGAKPAKKSTPAKRSTPAKTVNIVHDDTADDTSIASAENTTDDTQLKTATIEFHGRTIEVKAPSSSQIIVIHRIEEAFSNQRRLEVMTTEQQVELMKRVLRAAYALMVNDSDKGFIDDLILDGVIELQDVLPLMVDAINAVKVANDTPNRSERRALAKSGAATLALD